MTHMWMRLASASALGMSLSIVSVAAYADDDAPSAAADGTAADAAPGDGAAAPAGAPAAAAPADQPAAKVKDSDDDEVRFRGGISGGGGGIFLNGYGLGLGGVDGRLGVQLMDLIGIYVQPQLGIYGGSIGGATGIGGLIGGSAVVDFTFIDQLFVGVGGGGGILNNPAFGEVHFRAGGYPLMGFGEDGIIRKGLMLSADVRLFFVSGTVLVSPTASIGYEVF